MIDGRTIGRLSRRLITIPDALARENGRPTTGLMQSRLIIEDGEYKL